MKQEQSKKPLLIIGIIIVIAAIVFFYFSGSPTRETDSLLAEQTNVEVEVASARVLGLLNQVQSLKIDQALFQSAVYRSLRDYSVAIPEQNVGRPNPFAPLPGLQRATPAGTNR